MRHDGKRMKTAEELTRQAKEFRDLIGGRTVRKLMGDMQGEQLSRVPKGFCSEDPAADLVRYKQYIFYRTDLPVEWATASASGSPNPHRRRRTRSASSR